MQDASSINKKHSISLRKYTCFSLYIGLGFGKMLFEGMKKTDKQDDNDDTKRH